jgi:hypothetical protein
VSARCDASRYFLRTGGRLGKRWESPWLLRARTAYFRDEYAYEGRPNAPHADVILASPSLAKAAAALFERPVVVPQIMYGNLLVPGQELGINTDVPAFRGVDRTEFPLWLLVVMRHSGLFERWRIPVATAVAYVGECKGGELVHYPNGPDGSPSWIAPRSGSVVMFDADTVFHGIDPVHGDDRAIRAVGQGSMTLLNDGDRKWRLRVHSRADGRKGPEIARFAFTSDDLRYSLSWKCYCFADAAERRVWENHEDDLDPGTIVDALVRALRDRELLGEKDKISDRELAFLLIDSFIPFPEIGFGLHATEAEQDSCTALSVAAG